MKKGSSYQTIKEAGYKHLEADRQGSHILLNTDTGRKEVFYTNKNHAGWALIYKNTHLEYGYTLPETN